MKYKLIGNPQGMMAIEDCINAAAQDGWRFCAVVESKRISIPGGLPKTCLSMVILMEKDES